MPLGIGLAALGRPGYINLGHGGDIADRDAGRMEAAAHAVLDAAYAGGIRHFDAARSYGRAEAFLVELADPPRPRAATTSSSARSGATPTPPAGRSRPSEHEVKDLSAAQLRRQWPETEALLGAQLRLYQIHSATLDSGVLDDPDVRAELDALRERGVRVGLSVTGAGQAGTIDRAVEAGGFDAVQATWNLHERSAGPALARAHAAGLEVYVKEGVANGRLTARGGTRRSPPRRASAGSARTRWRWPPCSRSRGPASC